MEDKNEMTDTMEVLEEIDELISSLENHDDISLDLEDGVEKND